MFRYVAIDDTESWGDEIQKLGKVYMKYVYDDSESFYNQRRLYFAGYYLTFEPGEDYQSDIDEQEGEEEEFTDSGKERADALPYDMIDVNNIEDAREYCRVCMYLPQGVGGSVKDNVAYPYSVVRFDDTENWGCDYKFPEDGKIYSRYVFDNRKVLDGMFRLLHFVDFVTDFHPTQKQLDYIKEIAAAHTATLILESYSVESGEFEPSLSSSCIEEAVAYCKKTSRIVSKSNKNVVEVTFDNKTFFLNEQHEEKNPLVNKEDGSFESLLDKSESLLTEALRKQVLKDALGEFITMRTPIEEYVRNRYEGQTPKFLKDKLVEVAKRVEIAEEIIKELSNA